MTGPKPGRAAPDLHPGSTAGSPPPGTWLPRIIVSPLLPPHVHPLGRRDVQLALAVLPVQSTAGLRSVSLLGHRTLADGTHVLASYRHDGFLRLHAVPAPPWTLPSPDPRLLEELGQYGARVESEAAGHCRVSWPGESLRLFFVMAVLLPGVARHRRERDGLHEPEPNVRCLAARDEAWWVSEESLRQWSALLRERGRF